jgi:uncharacterized membrane protein
MLAKTQWDRYAVGAAALVGLGLALSLALDDEGEFLATGLALGVLGVMLALGAALMYPQVYKYAVPLTAVAGLCVATYMAHIETTDNSAVCGIVGDCNMVQQSEYAEFLGLPVGVLGMFGYAALTIVWFIAEVTDEPRHKRLAQVALLAMALGGAAFSIYLTFLEPFVIGATCAWCLLSALTMLLILWLAAPEGFAALDDWRRPKRRSRRRQTI